MKKCPICLENVVVPVKLNCFECYKSHEIHCHTFQRFCLHCIFQSNTNIEKCIFCHEPKKNKTMEIDYDYISNDHFSIYTCVFCKQTKGSHLEIAKHIMENHVYHCACGEMIMNSNKKEHSKTCEKCLYCAKCDKDVINICKHKKSKRINLECQYCGKCITNSCEVLDHYLTHVEEYKVKIKTLREILTCERKQYHDLLHLIEDLC